MKKMLRFGMALALVLTAAACEDTDGGSGTNTGGNTGGGGNNGGGDTAGGGGDTAGGGATCDDESSNPLAGSCWENIGKGCFEATGACTYEAGTTTTIEWANGAKIVTEISGLSGGTITATSAGGQTCYTGTSVLESSASGFTSTATYKDVANNNDQYIWKVTTDAAGKTTSMQVTCPDGSTIDIPQEKLEAAQGCQNGGGGSACTKKEGSGGGGFPGACETDADCDGKKCCDFSGFKTCADACQ